jgi:hypothetical protein
MYYIENELTGIGEQLTVKDEDCNEVMYVEPKYYFLYGEMLVDNIMVIYPNGQRVKLHSANIPEYLLEEIEEKAYNFTTEHNQKIEA